MKKSLKILVFIVLILTIFIGCNEKKEENINNKDSIKIVKILDLSKGSNFDLSYEYPAQIEAFQDTKMAFEVSGKIVKFYYKEGEWVKKGSVIAKLDDEIYKANFDKAKANYNQAILDYKRYEKLLKTNSVARVEFEKQKQKLDVNKAVFQVAKKNLEETKLIAEFDGVLAKKLVNDFERVTAKQPIIRLQDNSLYKVNFFVPENDVLKIKGELTPKFISTLVDFYVYLSNSPMKIEAKLIDISTTAEEVTRTFEASLEIKPLKDLIILPGMTAKVKAVAKEDEKKLLFIPYSSVFTDNTKNSYVWQVDNKNRVKKVKVKLGRVQKNSVEVLSGLEKSSKIVLSGIRFLNENDEVKEYEKVGE
ncbi:efflux RND transporter periplasmic adaptor subunit [Halarcobacter ebronensis]|uniref:efflux RND transporter periplasmic adaptor subunit n=1 Tax=Halarcobacter ebronensis TaxID=1462615 RepID=UPI003C778ECA